LVFENNRLIADGDNGKVLFSHTQSNQNLFKQLQEWSQEYGKKKPFQRIQYEQSISFHLLMILVHYLREFERM